MQEHSPEAPPESSITVEPLPQSPENDSQLQELHELRKQLDRERRERQAVEARLLRLEQASVVPSVEREPTVTFEQEAHHPSPVQQTGPRGSSQPASVVSVSSRIEKIPNLREKLTDGIAYRPRLWQRQILSRLEWYSRYFVNDDHRKSYILDNTDGTARDFLEPLFLDPDDNSDPYDLVDSVCKFLTNPAEQSDARTKFKKLQMTADKTFWEFYHVFRTTATLAGIRDDLTLRTELRDKLLPRLRMKLTQEWRRCDNLSEWVAAIQEEDAAWIEERVLHGTPAPDKATKRSGIYANSRTARNNLSAPALPADNVPQVSFDVPIRGSTSGSVSSKDRPNTPWRNDTPRQQTPFSAKTSSSSVPPRHSTPRINEIAMDDDDLEDSYEDATEHLDADELEKAASPRAKDDA
jgi:hypothetical protein